jgi:hypothetical protein
VLFVSEASIVGNTILKGHMHRYEWSRDIDSGTAATRKAPLVNDGVETDYFLEKEGHIFCDFRFSSSFQKINMILLTRPEGGLIGRIILIGAFFPFISLKFP